MQPLGLHKGFHKGIINLKTKRLFFENGSLPIELD